MMIEDIKNFSYRSCLFSFSQLPSNLIPPLTLHPFLMHRNNVEHYEMFCLKDEVARKKGVRRDSVGEAVDKLSVG